MSPKSFLTRVVLENYKSIASCDVRLGPLMFLVGPNAAGKSNFLDGLEFVSDAASVSLSYALGKRGGLGTILRRSREKVNDFGIRLEFDLPDETRGVYALRVGWMDGEGAVLDEECVVRGADGKQLGYFRVRPDSTEAETDAQPRPALFRDNLYLHAAAGVFPALRLARQRLAAMRIYNLDPVSMAGLCKNSAGSWLQSDGRNLPAVLEYPPGPDRSGLERIVEYLQVIVPTLDQIEVEDVGPGKMIRFWVRLAGFDEPQPFWATQMSDGTLRALGVLTALLQAGRHPGEDLALVGIENPETQIHPTALGVLLDAMREASYSTQVFLATHSSDLLDDKEISAESILAVTAEGGETRMGPLGKASRSVLRDRLFTAGGLLRINYFAAEGDRPDGVATPGPPLFDVEEDLVIVPLVSPERLPDEERR